MIEIKNNSSIKENCALIALDTGEFSKEAVQEHLDELERLADTAGGKTVFKIIQERSRIDSAYFIGKGKVEEIALLCEDNDIKTVIFDDELSPVQIRNLEQSINRKILDRNGLILDIFASHAKTKEAKTQVELAQLEYLLPRLTRAWTHLSKQYGGIGTKGPGETQIETDRRMIRTKIAALKEKLKKIEAQRIVRSSNRKDFLRASLVGYTNAGKSTILNFLTDADILAEDKLFATLDSTTRIFELNKSYNLMLSDTVGFIRKLPHNLIASFQSTLNEVVEADIILHVIDVSHPFYQDHIEVVEKTLKDLGVKNKTEFKIFNKVDALKDHSIINLAREKYENAVFISAAKGINISKLRETLLEFIIDRKTENVVRLKIDDSKTISKIHALAEVLFTEYEDDVVTIKYRTDNSNDEKLKKLIYEKTNSNN